MGGVRKLVDNQAAWDALSSTAKSSGKCGTSAGNVINGYNGYWCCETLATWANTGSGGRIFSNLFSLFSKVPAITGLWTLVTMSHINLISSSSPKELQITSVVLCENTICSSLHSPHLIF